MKTRRRFLLLFVLMLLLVLGSSGLWLYHMKQQYTRNCALISALVNDDMRQALVLVNAGADVNTLLDTPPALSLPQLLRYSLKHTPPADDHSPTAFLLACGEGWELMRIQPENPVERPEDVELAQAMLTHGADIRRETPLKDTALHGTIRLHRPHIMELLLARGVDVNRADTMGVTPLMLAAEYSDREVVRVLLEHGAHVNAQDEEGNTPLYNAVLSHKAESVIPELLAHGADLNIKNRDGYGPLEVAQKIRRPDLIPLLKSGGK